MRNNINEGYSYKEKGQFYLSALRYSEHVLLNSSKHNIQNELNPKTLFSPIQLLSIVTMLKQEISKTEKILSIGKKWNDDEYLYVLTTIIGYNLLSNYFMVYDLKLDANLINLYTLYNDSLENKENAKAAFIAKGVIKKSRKDLPEEWLNEILG
jgi:hypothetical protein